MASTDSWVATAVGFGIPFLLIFTLAVEAGGYEVVLRSQTGIIAWWAVLLGLAAGLLPSIRVTRPGWIAVSVFAGLVALTALATLTWTESAERSAIELSRTLAIFGVFVLLLLVQGKDGLRRSLAAVGVATALVALIALVDRFDPGLLPFGASQLLPENYPRARLSFPIEYWNGLAAMMAIGIAPLLWLATSSREGIGRSLAAAAIPLVILATYLTASRGGTVAAFAALLVLFLLSPERLKLAVGSLFPVAGGIALGLAIGARPEIRDLRFDEITASQGSEMMWICLVVALVVAALQYLLTDRLERGRLRLPVIDPQAMRPVGVVLAASVAFLLLAGLVSGFASDRWTEFQQPAERGTVSRLSTVNSGERYLLWDAALRAADSERLTGIGPGAYEYWWAREGEEGQFVRDAHSLYLEMLAEMGPLGFLLILFLVLGPIGYAIRLSIRWGRDPRRAPLAAAAGGMVAFSVAAGVDWAWEITVLPVAFFALVAAVLGPELETMRPRRRGDTDAEELRPAPATPAVRLAAGIGALLAIAIIALPMAATQALESSQSLVREGDLEAALGKAERAAELQPFAASPKIQQAQVLELLDRHAEAVSLAREAIEKEQGNWRNWLVLSQLLAESSPARSARALEQARQLNPKSTLPELVGRG